MTVVSGRIPRGRDNTPSRIEFEDIIPFPLFEFPLGIRLLTFHNFIVLSIKITESKRVKFHSKLTIGAKQEGTIPKGSIPFNMINFFFNF